MYSILMLFGSETGLSCFNGQKQLCCSVEFVMNIHTYAVNFVTWTRYILRDITVSFKIDFTCQCQIWRETDNVQVFAWSYVFVTRRKQIQKYQREFFNEIYKKAGYWILHICFWRCLEYSNESRKKINKKMTYELFPGNYDTFSKWNHVRINLVVLSLWNSLISTSCNLILYFKYVKLNQEITIFSSNFSFVLKISLEYLIRKTLNQFSN